MCGCVHVSNFQRSRRRLLLLLSDDIRMYTYTYYWGMDGGWLWQAGEDDDDADYDEPN